MTSFVVNAALRMKNSFAGASISSTISAEGKYFLFKIS